MEDEGEKHLVLFRRLVILLFEHKYIKYGLAKRQDTILVYDISRDSQQEPAGDDRYFLTSKVTFNQK